MSRVPQREYSQALTSIGPDRSRVGTRPGSASVARPGSALSSEPRAADDVRPSQLVQGTSSASSAPPKRPSVSDFLSLGSSLAPAPAAAASAAPAAIQRKATATDFLSALDGISIAPSPTMKATRPATADSATLSALAALRGYSEDYSLPARDSAIGSKGRLNNPKIKLMAARASADQLLIDRVAAAEAKAEQAALSAQKASRQLATLRAKVARIEEERDQASRTLSYAPPPTPCCIIFPGPPSHNLRFSGEYNPAAYTPRCWILFSGPRLCLHRARAGRIVAAAR